MVKNLKLAEAKVVTYHYNPDSKYYELQKQPPGFNRLPNELQVQDSQTREMKERGAEQVIQGRTVNGKRTFFSGMRATPDKRSFFGDDGYTQQPKKSFCLFRFSSDSMTLTVHYFRGFIPLKPMREQFIQYYLESFKKKEKKFFRTKLPMNKETFDELFDYLHKRIGECYDYTMKRTLDFLNKKGIRNIDEVIEWLNDKSVNCDYDILLNVEEMFENRQQY